MALTIEELHNKQCEEMFDILMKQIIPNKNVMRMLHYIWDKNSDICFSSVNIYNYGRIKGIRSERDRNKWNTLACFNSMKAYASAHNNQLPNDIAQLKKWVSRLNSN